ncbi:MAG: glycosyltransferase family 2 protein [Caldilineaceae bacterium]
MDVADMNDDGDVDVILAEHRGGFWRFGPTTETACSLSMWWIRERATWAPDGGYRRRRGLGHCQHRLGPSEPIHLWRNDVPKLMLARLGRNESTPRGSCVRIIAVVFSSQRTGGKTMIVCTTVIPTINRATLERSVKSALAQVEADAHEILVFNSSKAPLLRLTGSVRPRSKSSIPTPTSMTPPTRKAEMAAGKYINFLHDDDYLLPGALRALMDAAEASGDVWVCGAYNLIDDDGRFMSTVRPVFRKNFFAKLVAGECLHLAP